MNNNDIMGLVTLKLWSAIVLMVGQEIGPGLALAYRIKILLRKYKMTTND